MISIKKNIEELYRTHSLDAPRSIRVLDIEPATDFDAPVLASIRVILLPSSRDELYEGWRYQALSYSWLSNIQNAYWSPPQNGSIIVDGCRIPISHTLHNAFRRIRETIPCQTSSTLNIEKRMDFTFSPTLWVDAICIDQKNAVERQQQVSMMGDIYHLASRLIIWLRETPDRHAFETTFVGKSPKEEKASKPPSDRISQQIAPPRNSAGEQDTLSQQPFQTPERLLSCRWFERRWVLQEVLRSAAEERVIMFGPSIMKFNDFVITLGSRGEGPRQALFRDALQPPSAARPDLLSNLLIYDRHDCIEDHDRVYALLGISTVDVSVPIDYDMDMKELSLRLARQWIQRCPTAVMACVHRQESSSGPSWIPDWKLFYNSIRPPGHEALVESCISKTRVSDWNVLHPPKVEVTSDNASLLRGWIFRPCSHQSNPKVKDCLSCFFARTTNESFYERDSLSVWKLPDLLTMPWRFHERNDQEPDTKSTFSRFKKHLSKLRLVAEVKRVAEDRYAAKATSYRKRMERRWGTFNEQTRLLWIKGSRMGAVVNVISEASEVDQVARLRYCFPMFKDWMEPHGLGHIKEVAESLEDIIASRIVKIV